MADSPDGAIVERVRFVRLTVRAITRPRNEERPLLSVLPRLQESVHTRKAEQENTEIQREENDERLGCKPDA